MAQSHEDLLVWQKAMDMTVAVYEFSKRFPREEVYGLTSQLLGTAQGSNFEVQTQLVVAKRLGYGTSDSLVQAQALSIEVGKMLSALIASVQLKARS